jgi:DNA-directed RNA polymerase subunit RPC12/RpoP
MPEFTPLSSQQVRCPHCGAIADRYFLDISQFSAQLAQKGLTDTLVTRTVCDHCDYLMVLCPKGDMVLEAYMAGF